MSVIEELGEEVIPSEVSQDRAAAVWAAGRVSRMDESTVPAVLTDLQVLLTWLGRHPGARPGGGGSRDVSARPRDRRSGAGGWVGRAGGPISDLLLRATPAQCRAMVQGGANRARLDHGRAEVRPLSGVWDARVSVRSGIGPGTGQSQVGAHTVANVPLILVIPE